MKPKTVKEAIIGLLCVKSTITLIMTVSMTILTYKRIFPVETYAAIAGSVFTYYFARTSKAENNHGNSENYENSQKDEE
jgi:hypothetical protein